MQKSLQKETKVMAFLEDIQSDPKLIKQFLQKAESLNFSKSQQKPLSIPSRFSSVNTSFDRFPKNLLQEQSQHKQHQRNKTFSEVYYFKFIHQQNKALIKRNLLIQGSENYIPYEAGKKIPLQERVQFYMQKLTDEEQQQQALKKNSKYQSQESIVVPTIALPTKEPKKVKLKGIFVDSLQADVQSIPVTHKSQFPSVNLSPIREGRKSKSQYPQLVKVQLQLKNNSYSTKGTLVSDQRLHIKQDKNQNKFISRDPQIPQDLFLKQQQFSKGSFSSSVNKTNDQTSFRQINTIRGADVQQLSLHNRSMTKKHVQSKHNKKSQSINSHVTRIFTLNSEEREEAIIHYLGDIKIFKPNLNELDMIQLEGVIEKRFRLICHEERDSSSETMLSKNLRLNKKKFRAYLNKQYNQRIVDKIIHLFDFVNPLDYIAFYRQIEETFLRSSQTLQQRVRFFKQLAFQLFDMNGDSQLCEYDLFSVVKNSNDNLFLTALQQDIKDIQNKLQFKQQFNNLMQHSFNEISTLKNSGKINNLDRFLLERQKVNEINNNFLSVFNTPKNQINHHLTFTDQAAGANPNNQDDQDVFKYTQVQNLKMKKQFLKHSDTSQQNPSGTARIQSRGISGINESAPPVKGRKQSIGHLLKKVQDMYQDKDVAALNVDEFCKDIQFKYGIPLLIIDFLQYITGINIIEQLDEQLQQGSSSPNVIETFDDEFLSLKQQINEDFYENHLLPIFNDLGEIEFKDSKQFSFQHIETRQYLTFNSVKKNMIKVFGNKHDYFAEVFFKYLSGGSTCLRISIKAFLKKFKIFWPKRSEDDDDGADGYSQIHNAFRRMQEQREMKKQKNKIAFEFIDSDKDQKLSILDLIKIESMFEDNSEIGIEVGKMMEMYKNKNVRPKYVRHQLVIDFDTFNTLNPESCIVKELRYILVDKYLKPVEDYINVFQSNPNILGNNIDLQDKKKLLNYDGIFDKELLKLQKK